ncbi:MAG: hypothetical protein K2K49_06515 [Duncaniella sp.]|nr:hypothetical protein [Duncaniella sp.]
MDNKQNNLREPRIRVSRRAYVAIMEAVIDEAVFLAHEEGMLLICAVRSYLHSPLRFPGSGDRIYKQFRRFRDIIDRAALRSARARAAAQRRRQSRLQSPEEQPNKPNTASMASGNALIGRFGGNNSGCQSVISETDRKIRHGEFGFVSGNG